MKKFFASLLMSLMLVVPFAGTAQEISAAKECHIVIEDSIKIGFVGNMIVVTYHSNTYEVCSDGTKTLVKDPYQ